MARGSTLPRLALALLIGAVAGPWFNFTHPAALDVALNALAIALPPLLAVWLMKTAQRGGALLRVGLAVALLVVVVPLGDVAFNAIRGFPGLDAWLVVGMAVALSPLIAAFTVGTRGPRLGGAVWLATGCGALAWIGVGLHNLLAPLLLGQFSATGPSSGFGDLVFAVLLIFYAIGFVVALPLGLLGAALRLWLARPVE